MTQGSVLNAPTATEPPQRHDIVVRGLTKRFGGVTAVDDVSFVVPTGSMFAFLGSNGAGKSTTISCLSTVLRPTAGEIEVAGLRVGSDDAAIRSEIGLVFQESLLDPSLTVRENLALRARYYGLGGAEVRSRIDDLAVLLELRDLLDRPYGKLSGGQRRRADIVRALLHAPKILFLDEPTTGLDPDSREKVWATVAELQHTYGITIFLTTRYMEETERADDVRIISGGRLVAGGTPRELRRRFTSDQLAVRLSTTSRLDAMLAQLGYPVRFEGYERLISVPSSAAALELLTAVRDDVRDFEFRHGTMDDVFLTVTRQEDPA